MNRNTKRVTSRSLPEGSKRITNAQGKRVWLIHGVEYLSVMGYHHAMAEQAQQAAAKAEADRIAAKLVDKPAEVVSPVK